MGLFPLTIGCRHALRQQSLFLVLHLANQRLKLGVPFVRHASCGVHCRNKPLSPAQVDDQIGARYPLGSQNFKGGKMSLLDRVIGCQAANDGLFLRNLRYIVPVCAQDGFIAGQHIFAAAGLDILHRQRQILDVFNHRVGMPHLPGAVLGDKQKAIGQRPHDQ